jgi:hypothetical protein
MNIRPFSCDAVRTTAPRVRAITHLAAAPSGNGDWATDELIRRRMGLLRRVAPKATATDVRWAVEALVLNAVIGKRCRAKQSANRERGATA